MITNRIEGRLYTDEFHERDHDRQRGGFSSKRLWRGDLATWVQQRPAIILGVGLAAGVLLGWLIKRR